MIKVGKDSLLAATEKISLAVGGKDVKVKFSILGKSKKVKAGAYSCLEAFDGVSMQIATYFISVIDEDRDVVFHLDGKAFISVIKVLSKLNKDFELNTEGNGLVIASGETKIRLPLFKDCALITMENDAPYAKIDVKRDDFFTALAKGGYASGDTEAFSGLFIQCVGGEGIEASTASSARFAVAYCAAKYDTELYKNAVLNAYLPNGVIKAHGVFSDETITLCFMNSKFVIKDKSSFIVMNRYQSAFGGAALREWKGEVVATMLISKKSMLTALEVSMLTEDVKENPVIIASEGGKLFMKTPLGSAKALIEGTVSGEFEEVYINPMLIRDAVNVTGDKIQIEYYGRLKPLKVNTEKDEKANFSFVLVVDGSKTRKSADKKEADKKETKKK